MASAAAVKVSQLLSFPLSYVANNTPTQNIPKQYARIIAQWPNDAVRPTVKVADALRYNIKHAEKSAADANAELRNINALNSLLGNRYTKKVCLLRRSMTTSSSLSALVPSLEELPASQVQSRTLRLPDLRARCGAPANMVAEISE